MAGILSFSEWIGGPDTEIIESTFPSSSKTYTYNFGQDITGWTFKLDCQTVIADPIAFDRNTGEPNFATSQVVGYFPYTVLSTASVVSVISTATGLVNVTHPANMYTGPILPDARSRVPLTVVGFTWADDSTPPQINTHRIVKVMAWEPQVSPEDPTTAPTYSPITLG
jgi:hypothetical protein